jgi:PAS domain S-box-containing protein
MLWRGRAAGPAQAEPREQALVAAILEVMPVAVFVVDRQHKLVHWNRACQELTGVAREAILGSDKVWEVFHRPPGISLADLIVEGDLERLRGFYAGERLRPSPIAPEAWQADSHFPDLGGRPKDLIFTAAPLRAPGGQVMGAVEAILDLTDITRLEAQLAESEALYRSLVEANREGIALHDGEAFIFANQPFLEMFGLTALEQAPEDFLELLSPTSQGAYLRWRRTLGAQGVSPLFEGQGQRGGTGFDLEMNAAPAVFKGRPALLFNIRDVTYRKSMEEQLIRSERLAATGKLAFDIAHEVNNPLGGILTFAHLMAEDLGNEHELRPTVDKIIKLTNRCKIIIRGMLDFARQDPPQKELMDLNQVIGETLSLLEGHVLLRGVELVLLLEPGLPGFYGHRGKLEQVFLNLLINAAEALEGRGRLAVRTWADTSAREIRVRLADDGPGMEEEVALRAFEPFFTTKARGRGTGLGLAICFGIVKQHEGRIELETAPGLGAAFTVVLPMNAGG